MLGSDPSITLQSNLLLSVKIMTDFIPGQQL